MAEFNRSKTKVKVIEQLEKRKWFRSRTGFVPQKTLGQFGKSFAGAPAIGARYIYLMSRFISLPIVSLLPEWPLTSRLYIFLFFGSIRVKADGASFCAAFRKHFLSFGRPASNSRVYKRFAFVSWVTGRLALVIISRNFEITMFKVLTKAALGVWPFFACIFLHVRRSKVSLLSSQPRRW